MDRLIVLLFALVIAGCQAPVVTDATRAKAEAGDPRAQLEIFWLNKRSRDAAVRESGFAWLRKSADQGYAPAEYHLALAFEFGSGVPKDKAESDRWFLRAAKHGHSKSQFHIARGYENGDGLPRDLTEAVEWYRRAALQNHGGAQSALARLYEKGEGVPRDILEAYAWYGAPGAHENLASRRRQAELEQQFTPEQKMEAATRAAAISAEIAVAPPKGFTEAGDDIEP